jgi:hypothetical protein
MNWSNYGKWLHPKAWWEGKLIRWIETEHPDKKEYNPKVIEVRENEIVFGMSKHFGRLIVSKETLLKRDADTNKNNFS